MPEYRSKTSTHGRNMAGAPGLWRAPGVKDHDFGKPVCSLPNSFTPISPRHVGVRDGARPLGLQIAAARGRSPEFNTTPVAPAITANMKDTTAAAFTALALVNARGKGVAVVLEEVNAH